MDWTNLITSLASVIATLITTAFILKRKRNAESMKAELESTDILSASNKECYEELTGLRRKFVLQEKRIMEFEFIITKLEQNGDIPPLRSEANEE